MSITRIEVVTGSQGAASPASITVNFAHTTLAGETIVAMYYVITGTDGIGPSSFVDNNGTNYLAAWESGDQLNDVEQGFYFAIGVAAGINTLTLNLPADFDSGVNGLIVAHYSGITAVDLKIAPATFNGSGQSSPWASVAGNTASPSEVLIGYAWAHNLGAASTFPASTSPFADAASTGQDNNGNTLLMGELIVSSQQTGIQYTGTTASSSSFETYAGLVSFSAPLLPAPVAGGTNVFLGKMKTRICSEFIG